MAYTNVPCWIREIPNHLKTQEICDEAVRMESCSLRFVPNHLKTQGMCNERSRIEPYNLLYIPDHLIMQEMCEEAMLVRSAAFFLILDRFKSQEMCIRAVGMDPWQLIDVPDWFVVLQEMWYEDFDDDDVLIKWYHDYQKREAQKAKIKDELVPIAWLPHRVIDWCMSENEKRCWK